MTPPARPTIASLIASATEIVCALGLRDHLVAISHECDFPEDVRGLPVLSAPKVDPNARGAEIDKQVRALVQSGLSVYDIRNDLLEQLAPDVIVTQDHCEVCAVSLGDVERAVQTLTRRDTRVCSLNPKSLADIEADFRRVGEATGAQAAADCLVAEFRGRLAAIAARVTAKAPRPRIALVEWLEPPMVAGGWMPEIARVAGGEPVIVTDPIHFATITWDDLRSADPDLVVVMPCGYPIEKTLAELAEPALAAEMRSLRAVRDGRGYVCDGNAYFNRPGPRIADSAEILAALLHPERFRAERARYAPALVAWS